MTKEQEQLVAELKKIEAGHPGHVGTIAWRARQEIEALIVESERQRVKH